MAVANVPEEDAGDFAAISDEFTEQLSDKSDWMANLPDVLHDVSLTELAIPGIASYRCNGINTIIFRVLSTCAIFLICQLKCLF